MDATYIKDSYNSLSIEGYKVTEELLERVRSVEEEIDDFVGFVLSLIQAPC